MKKTKLIYNIFTLLLIGLGLVYGWQFWSSVTPYWFHPAWTTDDSLQQVYPFHQVLNPDLFKDDPVTRMMEHYLPPLHWAIGSVIIRLTGDAIMMSHWMMAIQLGLSLLGIFLAIRFCVGTTPAIFGSIWLLHTRPVIQRLTAGLPRGWALVVFVWFLWALLSGRRRLVLAILLLGILLNPPATFLAAMAYAGVLTIELIRTGKFNRDCLEFICCAPVYALIAIFVTQAPSEIGHMTSLSVAAQTPEFLSPLGRFPFYPLQEVWSEFITFSFNPFIFHFYNPGPFLKAVIPYFVICLILFLASFPILKRNTNSSTEELIPLPLLMFGAASLIVYELARIFAFYLYVPNRHLQFPLTVFLICAITIGLWRLGKINSKYSWLSFALLGVLAVIITLGSGDGLKGSANFNLSRDQRGGVYAWAAENSEQNAVFAGEPEIVDMMPLFGKRKVYISEETAHPFYNKYRELSRTRLEQSYKAQFALDTAPLLELYRTGGVRYFVFNRRVFREISAYQGSPPFIELVEQLKSSPTENYLFSQLKSRTNDSRLIPYQDKFALVIDLAELEKLSDRNGT